MWDGAAQWESKSQRNILIFDFSENSQSDTVSFFLFGIFLNFFFYISKTCHKRNYILPLQVFIHAALGNASLRKQKPFLFCLPKPFAVLAACVFHSNWPSPRRERHWTPAEMNQSEWELLYFPPLFNPPLSLQSNSETILAQNRHKRGYDRWIYCFANWQADRLLLPDWPVFLYDGI